MRRGQQMVVADAPAAGTDVAELQAAVEGPAEPVGQHSSVRGSVKLEVQTGRVGTCSLALATPAPGRADSTGSSQHAPFPASGAPVTFRMCPDCAGPQLRWQWGGRGQSGMAAQGMVAGKVADAHAAARPARRTACLSQGDTGLAAAPRPTAYRLAHAALSHSAWLDVRVSLTALGCWWPRAAHAQLMFSL